MGILDISGKAEKITDNVAKHLKIKEVIWNALGEYANGFDRIAKSKEGNDDLLFFTIANNTSVYLDCSTVIIYYQTDCLDTDKLIKEVRKMANAIIAECKKANISITTRGRIDDDETLHIYFKDFPKDNSCGSFGWPGIRFVGNNFCSGEIGIGVNEFFFLKNAENVK